MEYQKIDGYLFTKMVLEGAKNLNENVKDIDALNVFPVPDGDTGTNMNLSFTSGVNELKNKNSKHIGKNAEALSKGLLMGARGNSGVILSQLFRGFSKYISSFEEIDGRQFAEALKNGVNTAYKAVMKPVEGTILTVAKDSADEAIKKANKETDITKIMEYVISRAEESLANTPNLLPVLKEVGVVDAGGKGLLFIYLGFLSILSGKTIDIDFDDVIIKPDTTQILAQPAQAKLATGEIEFGYCTEFFIHLSDDVMKNNTFNEENFKNKLAQNGDSIVVIYDDDIVKVHIHAEKPGIILNFAMEFGSLHKLKIENMREQHSHILIDAENVSEQSAIDNNLKESNLPKKDYGIIAVTLGEGIEEIFKSLGVDIIVSGGQTMNPSTEDLAKAANEINSENVFILPNNSNIILAAEQVQDVVEKSITVIPTKTMPQGIASLLSFNPSVSVEDNKIAMISEIANVKTGQVTFAVRDTNIDSLEIKEGDLIGISDGKIVVSTPDIMDASYNLLTNMLDEDDEILTIIYGEDVTEEQVKILSEKIESNYPDVELEIYNGKQPLYYFIFGIE